MLSLDKEYLENQAIPLVVSGVMRKLGQYQGKQELLFHQRPQLLKTLKDLAIIQSSESSNRIEGIIVSEQRLNEILSKNAPPKNRPEEQVVGYRDVLSNIHANFSQIDISPETILKLHKDMLRFTDLSGGTWKTRDNVIEERLPDGQWITRFIPVPASRVPYFMNELCTRFHRLWNDEGVDRIFTIFGFVFDFLCIHPFVDGNGRVSRLLTVLLLHKVGLDITKYISYEKLVEDTKESYYDVLQKTSQGWHERNHRLTPWIQYNIGLLINAYGKLENQVTVVQQAKGEKSEIILKAINELPTEFSIGDLVRLCPGVSRPLIRHVLETRREEKKIEQVGLGRNAKWKKLF